MAQRRPKGQIALSAGILALGACVLAGAWELPAGGGYAQVGPGVVPRIVGAVLLLLGAMLLREALTGGFRGVDEEAEVHLPMDWGAFAWVSGGIVAYGLLVERSTLRPILYSIDKGSGLATEIVDLSAANLLGFGPGGTALAVIPEPTSVVLLVGGLVSAFIRRR